VLTAKLKRHIDESTRIKTALSEFQNRSSQLESIVLDKMQSMKRLECDLAAAAGGDMFAASEM
jgi:hypothetical protein